MALNAPRNVTALGKTELILVAMAAIESLERPVSATGRPERELLPPGGKARAAPRVHQ